MTAKQFYEWCKEHGACAEGLHAIRGKTPAQWWSGTVRGGWMFWLAWARFPGMPTRREFESVAVNASWWFSHRRATPSDRRCAKAYRKAFGNPFLKTRKSRKSEVA